MRRNQIIATQVLTIVIMAFLVSTVIGAKPLDVIEKSNGYPSGEHYNLNLHGKDMASFACDPTPDGNSVFIEEYGESKIQYVTNKRSSVEGIYVIDPCAYPNDPAKIQLPYEPEGYFVFARLRAKPNNGSTDGEATSIILSPNLVVDLCNDTDPANPDFPDYTECPDDPLLALGLIIGNNVYEATDIGFVRFPADESEKIKGKGNAKAKDITRLFLWTGWVCEATLDTSGPEGKPDGVIDEWDVPGEYDVDGDGIESEELDAWRAASSCTYYANEWILNIADLVVTEQDVTNDGAKLLKIRFYPVATTDFVSSAY